MLKYSQKSSTSVARCALRRLKILASRRDFDSDSYSASRTSYTIQFCGELLQENVSYTEDGLEALVYTAQGDMRQAIGNLQSTHVGFGHVNGKNVFKVCDEPHPLIIKEMIELCAKVRLTYGFRFRTPA